MTQRSKFPEIWGGRCEGGLGWGGWAEKPLKLSWTHLVAVASPAATFIQFNDKNNCRDGWGCGIT